MKKFLAFALALAMVFSLAACGAENDAEENDYSNLRAVELICADSAGT